MIPYIFLLTVPILLYPFVKDTTINRVSLSKIPLSLFFVILTLLVMLRHQYVGNDTISYIHFFEHIARSSANQFRRDSLESGYWLFNWVVSRLSKNPHFFIAISGLAVSAMLYPTYRRLCEDAPLTIVLFCTMSTFLMMFSGIRQMLAIGMGMIAYSFVRRKKPVAFLLAVAVAMSIHTSAFMLLIMYPLYHVRLNKKWAFFMTPLLLLAFVFNRQIFHVLGTFLQSYTDYDVVETSTGAYTMLLVFLAFTVFSFVIPDETLLDDETVGLRNFLLFSMVIQMFAPLNYLAMRMNYYYIIFIPLLLPRIIRLSSFKYRGVAAAARNIMVVFFFVYFFLRANSSNTLRTVPYHFFWEYYR